MICGCEVLEERRTRHRMLENSVTRRVELKVKKQRDAGRNCIMSFKLCILTNTVRMIKAGERNAYWILMANPERKTPRRMWEDNTNTSRRDVHMEAVHPEIRIRIMIV
jgi:hypothetical protein